MPKKSGVSWAEASHGFWYGCTKVSAGCKNCYAERMMNRRPEVFDFRTVTRRKTQFDAPLRWEPSRIFVCPWSDFFHPDADPWRDEAWDVIRQTPRHAWLILTKRPELMADRLPPDWEAGWDHVWLGVSVEDQAAADRRVPLLVNTPATLRWVSAEPLLGPVDLSRWLAPQCVRCGKVMRDRSDEWVFEHGCWAHHCRGYDKYGGTWWALPPIWWLVAGGESGPQHRPMDMAWAQSLRNQALLAGIDFYFKQQSAYRPETRPFIEEEDGAHSTCHELPDHWVRTRSDV